MLRHHENSDSWKAGMYAIAVHLALLAGMLISFNWKAAHPVLNVTEVELWDKIPKSNPPVIQEEPKPEPKPEIKEEPKPEPKIEEKPKVEEPKVDIELEKKKKELDQKEKALEEKIKKEEEKKKIAQQMREEDLREKKAAEKKNEALRKLKEDMLNEDGADDAKAASTANASIIGEYTEKIKAKIRGNVNKTLCGDGNPELRFEIGLLPTGELSSAPTLVKSSGNSACDDAVERAITASQPLPLPSDPAIYSKFRNLNLRFKPND
jgi:colicin import membrane protein